MTQKTLQRSRTSKGHLINRINLRKQVRDYLPYKGNISFHINNTFTKKIPDYFLKRSGICVTLSELRNKQLKV